MSPSIRCGIILRHFLDIWATVCVPINSTDSNWKRLVYIRICLCRERAHFLTFKIFLWNKSLKYALLYLAKYESCKVMTDLFVILRNCFFEFFFFHIAISPCTILTSSQYFWPAFSEVHCTVCVYCVHCVVVVKSLPLSPFLPR